MREMFKKRAFNHNTFNTNFCQKERKEKQITEKRISEHTQNCINIAKTIYSSYKKINLKIGGEYKKLEIASFYPEVFYSIFNDRAACVSDVCFIANNGEKYLVVSEFENCLDKNKSNVIKQKIDIVSKKKEIKLCDSLLRQNSLYPLLCLPKKIPNSLKKMDTYSLIPCLILNQYLCSRESVNKVFEASEYVLDNNGFIIKFFKTGDNYKLKFISNKDNLDNMLNPKHF